MTVKTNKVEFGTAGTYGHGVDVGTDDNLELYLEDTVSGKKTLAELLASSISNIADLEGLDTDFAPQYYNSARLVAYLATAVAGNAIGISGDVGGNTTLGDHVMDDDIHQRVPKFVLRVAKANALYTSIAAALAAIPTSGADVPSSEQWWRIEVAPGFYNESVLVDKSFVEIVGAGASVSRIKYNNSTDTSLYPLHIAASNVVVRDLGIESSNPGVSTNTAVHVGDPAGSYSVTAAVMDGCYVYSVGTAALKVTANASLSVYRSELRSFAGNVVYVAVGALTCYDCYIANASATNAFVLAASTTNVSLNYCRFGSGDVFVLVNSTVVLRFASRDSMTFATEIGGATVTNTSSTIYWDGLGVSGDYGEQLNNLTVERIADVGLYSKLDVTLDWTQGVQRRMSGGNEWESTTAAVEGQDFHFFRKLALSGTATDTGDVAAIGEESTGTGGAGANALALYVGGDAAGHALRWIDGDLVTGTERGYITRYGALVSNATSGAHDLQYGGVSRIKADETGLGFFGVAPAAQPIIDTTGVDSATIASIVDSLVALGLATSI